MRFSIVSKNDIVSTNVKNQIFELLCKNGAIEDELNCDIVISIGGDGTMLRAVHKYIDNIDNIYFVGVHTGTLGFFTNYQIDDIESLVDNLCHKKPVVDEYSLIEVKIDDCNTYYALNELRVENNHHTQEIDLYLNNEYLQSSKGNGLCLATSIGSTGYNRSLRGPIIQPSLDVMIMNEIAAIQHRYFTTLSSPLVMDKFTEFKMIFKNSDNLIIGIDYEVIDNVDIKEVKCKLSKRKVKMLNYNEFSYVRRLRKAFLEHNEK